VIRDHRYRDLTVKFLSTLHVEVTSGLIIKKDILPFISIRIFMSLIWVPLIAYLVFYWVLTYLIDMSLKTLT